MARYPKLRVIGCHLGSNEEDLDRLAKRLDALPNLAIDVASRVRYLMAGDREKTRQFVLNYQDRIVYGTDFTLSRWRRRAGRTLLAGDPRSRMELLRYGRDGSIARSSGPGTGTA